MDTMKAIAIAEMNRDKDSMVFDWNKAAEIIKESGCTEASAGLRSDWEYTGGHIFRDGNPVPKKDSYTFLSSTWAIPELEIDGRKIECYTMVSETDGWHSDTVWPKSALDILMEGNQP